MKKTLLNKFIRSFIFLVNLTIFYDKNANFISIICFVVSAKKKKSKINEKNRQILNKFNLMYSVTFPRIITKITLTVKYFLNKGKKKE